MFSAKKAILILITKTAAGRCECPAAVNFFIGKFDMTMHQLTCDCGYTLSSEKTEDYCDKCGKKIFLDPADKRKHKFNQLYIYAIIISVLIFVGFIFGEMVAVPLMSL